MPEEKQYKELRYHIGAHNVPVKTRFPENSELSYYEKRYLSGSSYVGEWTKIGMEKFGRYTFLHGVVYEGGMLDGMFHGCGILKYPKGQMLTGTWRKGKITSWKLSFKNSTEIDLESYCQQPDRRFFATLKSGFSADVLLTNQQPTRTIPAKHYDAGDGFYNPDTEWIHQYDNLDYPLRQPAERVMNINVEIYLPDGNSFMRELPRVPVYKHIEWIISNCRKGWDQNVGYNPKLYEYWSSGRKAEKGSEILPSTEKSVAMELLNLFLRIVTTETNINEEEAIDAHDGDLAIK